MQGEREEGKTSPVIYYIEKCLNMGSLSVFLLCSMCICTDKFRNTLGNFSCTEVLLMVLICVFVLFLSLSKTIVWSYIGDSCVCHPLEEQISVVIRGIRHSAPCSPCPSMGACFRGCRGPAVCLGSLAVLPQSSRLLLPVLMQPCWRVRCDLALERYYLAWWCRHI